MSTFTAIALDRLLEPGASKPDKSAPVPMPLPNSQKLERSISAPATKNRVPRPQLKPALYTTPEVTPLPDSPTAFVPSPYVVNHKRRGPRLLKSNSEASVLSEQNVRGDEKDNGKSINTVIASSAGDLQVSFTYPKPVKEEPENGVTGIELDNGDGGDLANGHEEAGSSSFANVVNEEKPQALNSERDADSGDFFDPNDSMSFTSNTDGEENALKFSSPRGEFYDAWEELSSDGATHNSTHDVETELREIRLSLLMEIEKRKQAEETLNNMRSQWERIRQGLYLSGIVLPADLTSIAEGEGLNSDFVEDICQQLDVARFISNAIGRGTAMAEVQAEMETQLEAKNFEIARLLERLRCYETMNREMSQRNQEVVGMQRRERQRRSRRRRWIWGSITTMVALSTAAIVWSYLPVGRGSSSADHHPVPEHDDVAE